MHKFQITAEFSLTTEVECDGIHFDAPSGAEEFSDNSYFSTQEIEADGGEISYAIEAEDADAAEDTVNEVVYEGMEISDYNGLTWLVTNVSVTVDEIEEPMTFDRAVEILSALVDSQDSDEAREALDFLLAHIKSLSEDAQRAKDASLAAQEAAHAAQEAARACQQGIDALTATVTDSATEA